jgi:Flp pilus assembly protein TadD
LRLRPDLALAHNNLGASLDDQNELDEAIAEYRSALALKPTDAMVHYNLALALEAKGKMEDTLAEYRQAVKLRSNFALPEMNLGRPQKFEGDFEGAVAECRQALLSHPDLPSVLASVGNALDDEQPLAEVAPVNGRASPQIALTLSH